MLTILSFITSATAFNVLLLSDKGNQVTRQAWVAAVDFVSRSPLDVKLDNVRIVESQNCDGNTFYNTACSTYDRGILEGKVPHLIIDLTQCPPVNKAAKAFLNQVGLPSVSTTQNASVRKWLSAPNNQDAFVQFLSPQDMVLRIIKILSNTHRLKSVGILYDRAFGFWLYKSEDLLRDQPIRRAMVNVEMPSSQLRRVMRELEQQDVFIYFVLGSLMTISIVMDSVECKKHTTKKFYWYLVTQENGQLRYSCKNMPAVLIRPHPAIAERERFDQIRSFYSLEPHSEMDAAFFFNVVVKSILAYRSFSQSNSWAMEQNTTQRLCNTEDNSTIFYKETINFLFYFKEVFNPVIFSPLLLNESNGRGYMDFTMKMEQINGEEGADSIGFWKPTDLYFNTLRNVSMKIPHDVFKVSVVLQAPFMSRNIDDNGTESFEGYCVDILDEMSRILEFHYEIYVTPDNNFGILDDNGRWNGVIRELIEKNADIGLASLSITAERENVVDFTIPYYDMVGTTILMKKHIPKSSHFKFLTIIEKDVWISILVIYMVASFLLWMFDQFNARNELLISEPNDWNPEQVEELLSDNFTLKDFLWFCMISLTPQGNSSCCTTLPSYVTMGTWCLFGLAVISFYTANLAALLTVSQLDTNIQGLSDLASQMGIQYSPLNGSTAMGHFQRMADVEKTILREWKEMTLRGEVPPVWETPIVSKWQAIWAQIQHSVPPANQEDAVARVLASPSTTSGFAYIGDGTNMKYQVLTHCEVYIVGEEYSKLPLAIALQKNSPLKESFNKVINLLHNQRRLVKLKEKWWDENPAGKVCKTDNTFTDERTYLTNIGGVYALIIIGLLLAFFTLVFDYYDPKHYISTAQVSQQPTLGRGPPPYPSQPPFHRW